MNAVMNEDHLPHGTETSEPSEPMEPMEPIESVESEESGESGGSTNAPEQSATFDDFGLSEPMLDGIAAMGYTSPTRVQLKSIPVTLTGVDVLVRAKTGSGKTAAFSIPILEKVDERAGHVQAIALAPTRELALQVSEEMAGLARAKGVQVVACYGGVSIRDQKRAIAAGAQVVVGTPGRMLDLLLNEGLDLSRVRHAVLDEADEMLSMGFLEDVRKILRYCPRDGQFLLFSATLEPEVQRLVKDFLKDPQEISADFDQVTVSNIENYICMTERTIPKPRNLLYLMLKIKPDSAIIFANTKSDVALVANYLSRNGINAEPISSDLPQKQREIVMGRMRAKESQILVATDIAARGIDISHLTHVFNYTLPEDAAVYLHRVGRTGRIGKKGMAVSLVSGRELATQTAIEKRYNIVFKSIELGSLEELEAERVRHLEAADAAYVAARGGHGREGQRPGTATLTAVAAATSAVAPATSAAAGGGQRERVQAVQAVQAAQTGQTGQTGQTAQATQAAQAAQTGQTAEASVARELMRFTTVVAKGEGIEGEVAEALAAFESLAKRALFDVIGQIENEEAQQAALVRAVALALAALSLEAPPAAAAAPVQKVEAAQVAAPAPVAKEPVRAEPAAKEPVRAEPAAKEPVAEKAAAEKAVAKKTPAKKTPAANATEAEAAAVTEPVAKKTAAKKAAAKKAPAKEAAQKKAPAKAPAKAAAAKAAAPSAKAVSEKGAAPEKKAAAAKKDGAPSAKAPRKTKSKLS